jgi:hypothetical protein
MRALVLTLAIGLSACGPAPPRPSTAQPPQSTPLGTPAPPPAQASPACESWDHFCVRATDLPPRLAGAALSPQGLGPIHVGATIDEVEALVGRSLEHDNASDSDACREYVLAWSDEGGVIILTQDRRVQRVSVFGEAFPIATESGIHVGSSAASVVAAYRGARRTAAPYDDLPAYELLYWAAPNQSGLRFEIGADGKVARMHGGSQAIQYIEGCL